MSLSVTDHKQAKTHGDPDMRYESTGPEKCTQNKAFSLVLVGPNGMKTRGKTNAGK